MKLKVPAQELGAIYPAVLDVIRCVADRQVAGMDAQHLALAGGRVDIVEQVVGELEALVARGQLLEPVVTSMLL